MTFEVKQLIKEEVHRVISKASVKKTYPKLSEEEFNNCKFSDFGIPIPKKIYNLFEKFKEKYKELIEVTDEGWFYDTDSNPLDGAPDYRILSAKINTEEGTLDVKIENRDVFNKNSIEAMNLPIFEKKYDDYEYYIEDYEYEEGRVLPFNIVEPNDCYGECAIDYLKYWIKGINKTIKFFQEYNPDDDDLDDDARESKYNKIFGEE